MEQRILKYRKQIDEWLAEMEQSMQAQSLAVCASGRAAHTFSTLHFPVYNNDVCMEQVRSELPPEELM